MLAGLVIFKTCTDYNQYAIKQNDEIIIPSHTYIATAAAIKLVGAKPVLCECLNDGMMDTSDIEHRINNKTVAIMVEGDNTDTTDVSDNDFDEALGILIAHEAGN